MGLFSARNRGDKTSGKDSERSGEKAARPAASPDRGTAGRADEPAESPAAVAASRAAGTASARKASGTDIEGADPAAETANTTGGTTDRRGDQSMAMIGQSIVFKGELTGDEDLEIDGQVEGNVSLTNHQLTIGANGRVTAEVNAKSILVIGQVTGNLHASERIEIHATGVVNGDLRTPKLNVQEGAVLNGTLDMSSGASAGTAKSSGASASSSTSASSEAASSSGGDAKDVRKSA